jgi:hypothetical protein
MDAYGIITRRGHVLSPGAEGMLRALRETIAADPALGRHKVKSTPE